MAIAPVAGSSRNPYLTSVGFPTIVNAERGNTHVVWHKSAASNDAGGELRRLRLVMLREDLEMEADLSRLQRHRQSRLFTGERLGLGDGRDDVRNRCHLYL